MIQWSRVIELRDEVGPEDFDEVVDLFIEEVQEVINRLKLDVERSQLENDLHFLKGSALSLGFEDFSVLCQNGERKSAAGKAVDVDVAAIVSSFEVSRQVFQTDLNKHLQS